LDWRYVVGYSLAAISLFIAAGGGIGGGGILVPLYILVLGDFFFCAAHVHRYGVKDGTARRDDCPLHACDSQDIGSSCAEFPTNTAVALSNITIVGGAIANFIFNVGRRHAFYRNRPLIDWDLILAMEPATILGALLGGYLNKACWEICLKAWNPTWNSSPPCCHQSFVW
jgi:uncharacterized membrane protein YfcA